MANNSLETPINRKPKDSRGDPLVRGALKIIDDSSTFLEEFLDDVDKIARLYEDAYNIRDEGNEKLPAFILFQTIFNFVSRMKPIDVMVKRDGVSEERRRLVSEGIGSVLKDSGFVSMLRDDFGGFYQMLTYGDFFSMVGTDKKGLPEFRAANLVGLYTDSNTTTMRNKSSGGQATRMVAVLEYEWDEAIQFMPEIEKLATVGDLPSADDFDRFTDLQDSTLEQEELAKERRIQIGFVYNIGKNPSFSIIAGATAAKITELKGEDFPFFFGDNDAPMDEREFYIPILQWMMFPTQKGLFNAGFGHVCFKLSKLQRQLGNKAIIQTMDNTDPIRVMNLPQQQAGGFLAKVKNAQEAVKRGKKGIVINAFTQGDKQANVGFMDTLSTPQVTADFERLLAFFDKILAGFGIRLERVITDPRKTATAIEFEEESLGDVISQIQEQNASTYEFAVKVAMDFIKKNIDDDDETDLDVNKEIDLEAEGETGEVKFTLGMLAEELRAGKWSVVVNSRSGVYPSKTLDKFFLQSAINDLLAIGDVQGATDLIGKKHALNGINIKKRRPQPQQQAGVAAQPEEQMGEVPVAAVEELQI